MAFDTPHHSFYAGNIIVFNRHPRGDRQERLQHLAQPLEEIVEELDALEAEAKKTDKALRKILEKFVSA